MPLLRIIKRHILLTAMKLQSLLYPRLLRNRSHFSGNLTTRYCNWLFSGFNAIKYSACYNA